jgi:hypothetical protein
MNYSRSAKALIELRNWGDANLPTYGSLICYDLALHLLSGVGEERPIGLKQTYLALPYSEAHLRRNLRRFEQDNWVELKQHPDDARNRLIEPTEKMLNAYREYFLLCIAVSASID